MLNVKGLNKILKSTHREYMYILVDVVSNNDFKICVHIIYVYQNGDCVQSLVRIQTK